MLRLVTVCLQAKAFIFSSGHPDVCTAIIIITVIIIIIIIIIIINNATMKLCSIFCVVAPSLRRQNIKRGMMLLGGSFIGRCARTVSYTHLTLPTSDLV